MFCLNKENLSDSDGNPPKFWKMVKSLKVLPKHIYSDDGPIFDKQEMGNVFNHHFITAGHVFKFKPYCCIK